MDDEARIRRCDAIDFPGGELRGKRELGGGLEAWSPPDAVNTPTSVFCFNHLIVQRPQEIWHLPLAAFVLLSLCHAIASLGPRFPPIMTLY
jgi:hypothetical protein